MRSAQLNETGRLAARPNAIPPHAIPPGIHPLGIGGRRDGRVSVPPSARAGETLPLLVLLHGAGADAACLMPDFQEQTDAAGLLVLAPDSRGATWDIVIGRPGPDVAFLNEALDKVFSRYAIRADRVAIAGFSDGASYALSLGLANGDLFDHVLAFSPGFMAPPSQQGEPRIFISHGTEDAVLPIDPCSRRLRPLLTDAGYEVSYHEFAGGHSVPPAMMQAAFQWWLQG